MDEGDASECGDELLGFFLRFRDRVIDSFPSLFGDGNREESDLTSQGGFGTKWGWYQSIYALAGKDVSRIDKVTKIPLHQCLIWLEFEKEKNELEQKMIKNAYNKNR